VTKIISVRSASRAGSKAWLGTFLFFVFLFPSLYQFEKYIGMVGVSAFIVIGLIVSILFFGPASMKIFQNLSDRQAKALCAVLFTIVIIIFLFGYPLANSGRIGGGSDLDEELDSSVRNILAGRSPYEGATYLGNSIDLLPGEFFLSLPFVVLGYSAYQNFFWLACFLWTAAVFLKDYRSMLLLFAALLIFCPAVWQELIVGSDRFTNGIHILVAVSLLMTVTSQETGWRAWLGAILLGVSLSSRLNFLALAPMIFALLTIRGGWKRAAALSGVAILFFSLVTIPFYLAGPDRFPPLTQVRVVQWVDDVWAFSSLALPAISILASVLFAARLLIANRRREDLVHGKAKSSAELGLDRGFLWNAAIVLAIPVIGMVVLSSIGSKEPTFLYSEYGVFYVPFGALAFIKDFSIPRQPG
jgi:hypothetical protein